MIVPLIIYQRMMLKKVIFTGRIFIAAQLRSFKVSAIFMNLLLLGM